MSLGGAFSGRTLLVVLKPYKFQENWRKIRDFELRMCDVFLGRHRFLTPRSFSSQRLEFVIYTDARATSHVGKISSIGNLAWVGGDFNNKWGSLWVFPIEINDKIQTRKKRVEAMRRIISFSDFLGTYAGARLWAPGRSCNTDLIWLEIPIVTDYQGNNYISEKNYTTYRPNSRMSQELAAHNQTNNIAIISRHCKEDSGLWSLFPYKTSRDPRSILGWAGSGTFRHEGGIRGTLISEKKGARHQSGLNGQEKSALASHSILKRGLSPALKIKNMTKLNAIGRGGAWN